MIHKSWKLCTSLLIFLIEIFLCCSLTTSDFNNTKWNATWTDSIKRDLLINYDKYVRPSDHNNASKLVIGLTVNHVDLDELKGTMTAFSWIKMHWNDEKLKWNASNYGNLDKIHVAGHEIWQPDLTLYNSASSKTVDHYGDTLCIVYSTGKVLWVPPAQFEVFCQLDLKLWPYDTQTCILLFGSWTYNAYQIDLDFDENDTSYDDLIENHEWMIKNVSVTRQSKIYSCCEEPYQSIKYDITLERRSPMYKSIVITPAICIILMTLSCFWLPPKSGEKIILNGLNVVVISIFLLYFAQKLPVMALHTPLIVLFYSSSLYLVCISMIVSVFVLYMSRSPHGCGIPRLLKGLLDGWMGTIFGVPNLNSPKIQSQLRDEELREQPYEDSGTRDDRQILNNILKDSVQQDWIRLAVLIDRIFFLIYCLIFIVISICYSV